MIFNPRRLYISIIGAGRVGTTLARMLQRSGVKIDAVVSRNKRSAFALGRLVSCDNCSNAVSVIPSSTNLIVIAVPDQSIRGVAQSLSVLSHLHFRKLAVCHTSGALTSDVLQRVARKGARVFSLHPVQTFPKRKSLHGQIVSMKNVTYGVEGKARALPLAFSLVRRLGGKPLLVPKEAKILYHLVCVIASNYSVALIGAVEEMSRTFTRKGLSPFRKLIETSVGNALESGAVYSLTGPIVRGDEKVVASHLRSLKDPELRALYRSLGMYTLRLASRKRALSSRQTLSLRKLLEGKG